MFDFRAHPTGATDADMARAGAEAASYVHMFVNGSYGLRSEGCGRVRNTVVPGALKPQALILST